MINKIDSINKVIDYVTVYEACKLIGISEKSFSIITQQAKANKIAGAKMFGKSWAIPIEWVKAECDRRGITFDFRIEEDKKPVSLDDYIPLIDYVKQNNLKYGTIHNRIARGQYNGDWIRFHTTIGIKK